MGSVVYCVDREGLGAVFYSQVLQPLHGMNLAGVKVTCLVLCPIGDWIKPGPRSKWKNLLKECGRESGLPLYRIATSAFSKRSQLLDGLVTWLFIVLKFGWSRPVIIQCRNLSAARVGLVVRRLRPRVKVIYDSRTIDAAELEQRLERKKLYLSDNGLSVGKLWQQQHQVVSRADHVLCVSQPMADLYKNKFRLRPDKASVVPCTTVVEQAVRAQGNRNSVRELLKLSDRLVIAFYGSASVYQCLDESLTLFKQLHQRVPHLHLLALSSDVDLQKKLAKELPSGVFSFFSLAPQEAFHYLVSADVGLLIREPIEINRVASPVKLAEFLACGVPVLVTEGVGDYSTLVDKSGCGLVVKYPGTSDIEEITYFLKEVETQRALFQEKCTSLARAELDVGKRIEHSKSLYRLLAHSALVE